MNQPSPFDPALDAIAAAIAERVLDRIEAFLQEEATAPAEVLTNEEAARYLRVSTRTIYTLVRERALPCCLVGDSPRYLRDELRSWLTRNSTSGRRSAVER